MKGMKSANEFYTPPPAGAYRGIITAATAGFAKSSGASHIELDIELADGPGKGESGKKWLGTDGGTKYGSMAKANWRALGINVDSDAEIDDNALAASLVGRQCIVVTELEQQNSKNPATGAYDVPATYIDANGNVLPQMRWVVKGFKSTSTAGIQAALQPAQNLQAAAPQFAQPQFAQNAQPPFAATQAPGGFQPPAFAQPQFQQPVVQAAPATPVQDPVTGLWSINGQLLPGQVQNGAQTAAQPTADAGGKKRTRTQIQDV